MDHLYIWRYIYRNELDKACFQYDMVCGDFKDLPSRIASDKILLDKAFNIAKNLSYDGNRWGLASMVYNFFVKKSSSGSGFKSAIKQNEKLVEELHKPTISKF